jgi:diguanylate cyclase (GGDEF)-like protein
MERPRSDHELEPSEIRRRLRSITAGMWLTYAAVATTAAYVALTWDRPHRSALVVLLVVVVVGSSGVWLLPRERIVRGRRWIWFFLAWSAADIVVVTAMAAFDGQAESPLALVLVLPLVFAATFYPTRPIVAVGLLTVAAYVGLGVAGHNDFADVVLVSGLLAMTAWLCGWQTKIGERQRAELQRVSRADPLTGCLNRRGFEERLDAALAESVRGGRPLALVLVDLDDFKAVNDRHGHAAGDELLRWTVGAIAAAVRPSDAVGRLGGDEFAVLLGGAGHTDAELVAERVCESLGSRISCTVGLACFPTDGADREELMQAADAVLIEAKQGRALNAAPGRRELSFAAALAEAVDMRMAPADHSSGVARVAAAIGARMDWSGDELSLLRMAGMLHDIGKVAVPDRILRKRGALTPTEYEEVKRHAAIGADIVGRIDGLQTIAPWIRHSHEHVDGSGYPDGLRGDEIPLASRILLVADAYDAMTTDRPYRSAMAPCDALTELRQWIGHQFDPSCVEALGEVLAAEGKVAA